MSADLTAYAHSQVGVFFAYKGLRLGFVSALPLPCRLGVKPPPRRELTYRKICYVLCLARGLSPISRSVRVPKKAIIHSSSCCFNDFDANAVKAYFVKSLMQSNEMSAE
jgi:hypothetical protein